MTPAQGAMTIQDSMAMAKMEGHGEIQWTTATGQSSFCNPRSITLAPVPLTVSCSSLIIQFHEVFLDQAPLSKI